MALPMLAGNVLNTGYGIVNTLWIGHFAGELAVGASAISFPVVFVFVALAAGATMATTILVSQYYGARQFDKVEETVGCSFALALVMGAVLATAGFVFSRPILVLMRTPPEILEMAVSYLQISFLAFVPMYFSFLVASILRGIGDTKTPLAFMAAGVALNAVLDPLLIVGPGPFPAWGLNGAAIASVISSTFAVLLGFFYLNRGTSVVAFRPAKLNLHGPILRLMMKVGLPSAAQQSFVSLGMATLTGIVNTFGAAASSAFGVTGRIDSVAFMPAMSIGMAVSALAGQNLGAGQPERVREVFAAGLKMTLAITGSFAVVFVAIPHLLMHAFVQDPAVVEIGVSYLRIVAPASVLFAVMFVSNGVINGAGHTTATMVFTVIALWGVRVPLALILARTSLGITGVWISFAVGFGVAMTMSLLYYRSGKWRTVVTRARG